jgi:hypothetical protein
MGLGISLQGDNLANGPFLPTAGTHLFDDHQGTIAGRLIRLQSFARAA